MPTIRSDSIRPLPAAKFGRAEARHLLLRAGLGGDPAQIRRAADAGPEAAVDRLVDFDSIDDTALPGPSVDPDVIRPPTDAERAMAREARRSGDEAKREQLRKLRQKARRDDRQMISGLRRWWLQRLAASPRPLEEKLVLLWHGHFAASHREVRDAYLLYQQHAMFRQHATDFAALARGIVRDPAMIRYLNNDRNVKRKPNENLARELMELFTLGEGNYTEADIKEGARALTGYTYRDNAFVFRPAIHDQGPKRILGVRGAFDGDAFVKLLLARDDCPRFVAVKLYRHFVADVPDSYGDINPASRAVIEKLAAVIKRDGYDLKPALRLLFRSEHFYDPGVVGQKIKSPAELVAASVRTLHTPDRQARVIEQAMAGMGQRLFEPPSVAGWDGGRSWVNTSTLFVRQNLLTYLITGMDVRGRKFDRKAVRYDPLDAVPGLKDVPREPEPVVTFLVDLLLGGHTPDARRAPLVKFMAERDKGVTPDSTIALLLLITAMPEYQLC